MTSPLALDTETTGLRPFQGDRATIVSLADDEHGAWALPAGDEAARVVREAVDAGRLILMHNSVFDRAVLAASFGIEIPDAQVYDTQGVDWMLDENQDHRLKEGIGTRLFGVDAKAEQEAMRELKRGRKIEDVYRELREVENVKPRADRERAPATRARAKDIADASKRTWAELGYDDEVFRDYAIQDARLTLDIYHWQQLALEQDGFVAADLEREQRIAGFAYRLQRTGVRVDGERAQQELEKAEARIAELSGPFEGVNLKSTKQMAELLYDTWGLECPKLTKAGARSSDKEAMEMLSYDPRIRGLQEFRSVVKQVDAYYLPLLDRLSPDGRIHPSFNPFRTVTGRFSCSGPNLQTIPRESTAAAIRQVFIPADGCELTEFDLSQIEVRIAADLSKEPALLDVYARGGDIYQEMADAIGITRQEAKEVILSAQYGVGAKTLSITLTIRTGKKWTEAQAKAILKAFWKTYPLLNRVMRGLSSLAERHGFVPLGRAWPGRRRLYRSPAVKWPKYYSALNARIQGPAAEFLKDVALELEPAIAHLGTMVLTVHDSFVIEHSPGAAPEIARILEEITRALSPFGIETPWEAKAWR